MGNVPSPMHENANEQMVQVRTIALRWDGTRGTATFKVWPHDGEDWQLPVSSVEELNFYVNLEGSRPNTTSGLFLVYNVSERRYTDFVYERWTKDLDSPAE